MLHNVNLNLLSDLNFRHTSKFRETVKIEEKVTKRPAKTMGPAEVAKPQPDRFLKKHEKEPKLPASEWIIYLRINMK